MARLQPKNDVIRELYLKSGNQCAFPGCHELVMNLDGVFIAQLCHIEAAEEGGERFNKDMDDEDRRAFPNLMLMCYPHHQITNNVDKYPVPVLQKMKADHEAKFTDVVEKIRASFEDLSEKTKLRKAASLKAINETLGWNNGEAELKVNAATLNELANRVQKLPPRTRQLLAIIVSRLERIDMPHRTYHKYEYARRILAEEVREACDIEAEDVKTHCSILKKYGIGELEVDDNNYDPPQIHLFESEQGWYVWEDIREFCEIKNIPVRTFIEELQFDLLD